MTVFSSKAQKIFELLLDFTSDSIVDIARHQWTICQLEHITETRKNNIPNSYRDYVVKHLRLFQERPVEENRYARIESSLKVQTCKLCNKKINDYIDINNKPPIISHSTLI